MTTETFCMIADRFGPPCDDGVTSADFFIIMMTQNFQKLIKIAAAKIKSKASSFSVQNCLQFKISEFVFNSKLSSVDVSVWLCMLDLDVGSRN